MKTLLALLTGAVLGTVAALWMAARGLRNQPALESPAPTTGTPAIEPSAASEDTPTTEEAPA